MQHLDQAITTFITTFITIPTTTYRRRRFARDSSCSLAIFRFSFLPLFASALALVAARRSAISCSTCSLSLTFCEDSRILLTPVVFDEVSDC
jgi:hypothetical protein